MNVDDSTVLLGDLLLMMLYPPPHHHHQSQAHRTQVPLLSPRPISTLLLLLLLHHLLRIRKERLRQLYLSMTCLWCCRTGISSTSSPPTIIPTTYHHHHHHHHPHHHYHYLGRREFLCPSSFSSTLRHASSLICGVLLPSSPLILIMLAL